MNDKQASYLINKLASALSGSYKEYQVMKYEMMKEYKELGDE